MECDPNKDHGCMYDMNYCKAAQREGRCKEETLSGIWRGIETNLNFATGELDV